MCFSFKTDIIYSFYLINYVSACIKTSTFSFQRENLEMFLKGCEKYGLKRHDLFQVNDLYERKNLYTVSEIDLIIRILEKKQLKKIPVNETVRNV